MTLPRIPATLLRTPKPDQTETVDFGYWRIQRLDDIQLFSNALVPAENPVRWWEAVANQQGQKILHDHQQRCDQGSLSVMEAGNSAELGARP